MKRLTLIIFMLLLAVQGFSQDDSKKDLLLGLYGGAGWTPTYNYDLGISGGFNFEKGIGSHSYLGATLFYQGYSFLYDKEAYSAKHGKGVAGVTLLNKSSYIFVAPKFSHNFSRKKDFRCSYYVDAGAGFKMSGTETFRKWDSTHGSAPGNFDSTIATEGNLNSLLIRVAVGLTQYIHLGQGKWWFSLTEDFGFLANSLSKTGDFDVASPSRTPYSPNKLNPAYISLQIGISHSKL